MPVILLSIAMLIISIIFKLAAVFRLTIPLLYVVAMNTFWRSWYQAHQSLGDIIFFVLLGLVVLSWIISLVRKIQSIFQKRQEEKTWRVLFAIVSVSSEETMCSRMSTAAMPWT